MQNAERCSPTPPSDAGTSEREAELCARCLHSEHPANGGPCTHRARQGSKYGVDCFCPEFVPAAPAAEGPRADWKCTNIRSHFADEWMCGTLNGADEESCGACGADRPVAALPGAEAGTLYGASVRDHMANTTHLMRLLDVRDATIADLACGLEWVLDILDRVDERLVQLGDPAHLVNSRVHLAAKAKARAAIRVARLASPSPTGAPAGQQKN